MSLADRRANARARAEEIRQRDAAERERRERLVPGVCSACAGIVPAGTGTLAEFDPFAEPRARGQIELIDRERAKTKLAPLLGWRRRHDECATADGMVRGLIGVTVAPQVAGEALSALRTPAVASQRWPISHQADAALRERTPRAWAHVADDEREALRKAVTRARATVEPTRCASGACAWCGVAKSIGWRASAETWPDGSPAPICGLCASVWDSRTRPTELAARRACALEALSGANSMGSDGLGIIPFAAMPNADRAGTAEPWSYAPAALGELRERARMMWPSSLPVELRDEYVARVGRKSREALEAAREAAALAAAEAEAAALAGWR